MIGYTELNVLNCVFVSINPYKENHNTYMYMCSEIQVVLDLYSSSTVIYYLKAKVTYMYSIFWIYLERDNLSYCLPLSKETDSCLHVYNWNSSKKICFNSDNKQ